VSDIEPVPGGIVPDMFRGPRRLGPVMPILRSLPQPLAFQILAGLAIGDGVVRASRLRRALAWATAQGAAGTARWRLALDLLANHGRFVAEEALLGVEDVHDLRRNVVLEGAEHLTGLGSGAILLGFHLGPPRSALVLRACGYPVRLTGRLETARGDTRWDEALRSEEAVRLPAGAPRDRAEGLYRVRNLLRGGALVYLAADGPFGREAFRLQVPGGCLIVRVGWLALRKVTRVPTLPILTYRDKGKRVIVIHPPLPDPDPDPGHDPRRDALICQAALAPLVTDYVRHFPAQCRYVALPRWDG